jgi:hypothetical protein
MYHLIYLLKLALKYLVNILTLTITKVICQVWSLDLEDGVQLSYHQATLLVV